MLRLRVWECLPPFADPLCKGLVALKGEPRSIASRHGDLQRIDEGSSPEGKEELQSEKENGW